MKVGRTTHGFMIVELLIVIVVIAILAAITIVAYNGVRDRANATAALSSATQAAKKIKVWQVDNVAATPSCTQLYTLITSSSDSSNCNFTFKDTSYQYTPQAAGNYCLTSTVSNKSAKAASGDTPVAGGCAGHGQNGVAAVTNLTHAAAIASRGSLSLYNKVSVSWGGQVWDVEFTALTVSHGVRAIYTQSPDEQPTGHYTAAVEVANPNAAAVTVSIDLGDGPLTTETIPAGATRVLSVSNVQTTNSIYRFLDINSHTTSQRILARNPTVLYGNLGSITPYSGSSPNWAWNGEPKASTSTGPM